MFSDRKHGICTEYHEFRPESEKNMKATPQWPVMWAIFIQNRWCYITADSVTPSLWNCACSKWWISEQMRKKMLMFHKCSIQIRWLLRKDCVTLYLFYTVRSKQTRGDSTHGIEQYLANCPKLLKLRPVYVPQTFFFVKILTWIFYTTLTYFLSVCLFLFVFLVFLSCLSVCTICLSHCMYVLL